MCTLHSCCDVPKSTTLLGFNCSCSRQELLLLLAVPQLWPALHPLHMPLRLQQLLLKLHLRWLLPPLLPTHLQVCGCCKLITTCKARTASSSSKHQCIGHTALFNPDTFILVQKCHPHTGNLNREPSGDSKSAFLHCGDGSDCESITAAMPTANVSTAVSAFGSKLTSSSSVSHSNDSPVKPNSAPSVTPSAPTPINPYPPCMLLFGKQV